MTRFREIPSLFHSSATQQISFSIMAIITLALLTFFYWHTPLLFTTLCIFQYLFCIQISKTQFKSLCIYFPGEDIYFTSGVQSIIIICRVHAAVMGGWCNGQIIEPYSCSPFFMAYSTPKLKILVPISISCSSAFQWYPNFPILINY